MHADQDNLFKASGLATPKPDIIQEWIGMPDFNMENLMSWQSTVVHFKNQRDRDEFAKLIGQKLTPKTRSIWYPRAEIGHFAGKSWESSLPHHQKVPRYPIYVITKGRWESRKTSKALEKLGLEYFLVVEPQEFDNYNYYASEMPKATILKLPKENYGGGCSIPARNFCWRHSRNLGMDRHWVLDDNIEGFFRLTDNLKVPVGDGMIFRAAEEFTDRYENVGMSGFNYFMFAPRKSPDIKPFTLNTRIYSCILLSNAIEDPETGKPFAWRGRYNEDTDLSLRILKTGACTVLFNAFLAFKNTTMTMKGGNTESLYQKQAGFDGRLEMAKSLKGQHPNHVIITQKWDRWQHHVDYSGFRQKLRRKPNIKAEKIKNNYEMHLKIAQQKNGAE